MTAGRKKKKYEDSHSKLTRCAKTSKVPICFGEEKINSQIDTKFPTNETERVEQALANNYNKQLERNIFHFILISLNSLLQKVNN